MGYLGALWGMAGVLLLVGFAILRIAPPAVDVFSFQLAWYHWLALLASVAVAGYFKGYRAFQRSFSPRVAARAKYIRENPTPIRVLLAPLFCMGYFDIVRRKQVVTYLMTLLMVGLIMLVRLLEQPWRGVVDAGILLGLSWGFISMLAYGFQALGSGGDEMASYVSMVKISEEAGI
jgi:hypothetical protein